MVTYEDIGWLDATCNSEVGATDCLRTMMTIGSIMKSAAVNLLATVDVVPPQIVPEQWYDQTNVTTDAETMILLQTSRCWLKIVGALLLMPILLCCYFSSVQEHTNNAYRGTSAGISDS